MASVVGLLFNLYALALIVYVILLFAHWPPGKIYAAKLQMIFEPLLIPLREVQKKTGLNRFALDLSPALLLVAIVITRMLVVGLLTL